MLRQNKLKSAQRSYEAALEVLSDNNRWGVAQVEYGMGTLARARGDAETAVRYYRDAMDIFRQLDAWPEIARCQAGIGWIAVTSGDFDQAQESLAENLRLNQMCGQRLGIARGLEAFAALAAARQQPERAAGLAGAACQLRETLGLGTGIGPRIEEVLEFARGRLGASAAAALFAEGREMTADDAIGVALGPDQAAGGPGPAAAGGPASWVVPPGAGRAAGGLGPAAAGGPASRVVPPGASSAVGGLGPAAGEAAWTDPARSVHRGPGPLTPREHEIVMLIAQGLSNREIADELVISPATAARHVANILAKLGFSSRTQVASWAIRREPPA
jgi:DNA-binding CsgD family transcriptional regulator